MALHKISLTEFETKSFKEATIAYDEGVTLWRAFDQKGKKLKVNFPSPKTEQQWEFSAQGWVGHIPVSSSLSLSIEPKTLLANIFGMWEYAYDLRRFQMLAGLTAVDSLSAFYERVVQLLLTAVQQRERKGFYRAYQPQSGTPAFVQGKIELQKVRSHPLQATLPCRYEKHTADLPENQILAFTLAQIARGRRCSPDLQTAVRRTTHHLQSITSPAAFSAQDCWTRPYNRLNQDYEPMHALCRFLLEHHIPTTSLGQHKMQPFLINMSRLYELFVANWLAAHLPPPWQIKAQETVHVGRDDELRFEIDLVLYDGNGRIAAVLDTKYKVPDKASNTDINQVVTYAQAKGCATAVLIYPEPLTQPLDVQMHNLHIRSLTFPVHGDLEEAGQQFLAHLTQH